MKAGVTYEIAAHTLHDPAEPIRGWCPDCFLPSLFSWTLALECDGKPWDTITVSWCSDCGKKTGPW